MVGRLLSFWERNFSGATLNFRWVHISVLLGELLPCFRKTHLSHEKKKNGKKNRGPLLSMKYWLFHSDPYNGLL